MARLNSSYKLQFKRKRSQSETVQKTLSLKEKGSVGMIAFGEIGLIEKIEAVMYLLSLL